MIDYEGLQKHREQTKKDILKLLETEDRVACVRPTGYGKSYMIKELYNELDGETLIITSTNILKNRFILNGASNCITYNNLHYHINDYKFLNKFSKLKYIILDEVHRLGDNLWYSSFAKFIDTFKSIKILGFTATPIRYNDNINVVDYIFNGVQIEPLDILKAKQMNFIDDITYISSYFNVGDIVDDIKTLNSVSDVYNINKAKIDNIYNIDNIIKKYYHPNTNGNKIIIFCSRISDLNDIKNYYVSIFSKLFPKEEIKSYILSYKDYDNDSFDSFIKTNTGINIIFTVNKLNEGVHIDNINTVIFMRPTSSEIIYFQQLGRAMNNKKSLIFDFSNNYNRISFGDSLVYRNRSHHYIKDNELEKLSDIITIIDYKSDIEDILKSIPTYKDLSEEQIQFIKDNAKNMTASQIAKELKVSKYTIRVYCYRHNIECLKAGLSEEQIQFIKDNAKNMTVSQIIKVLEVPHSTVYNYIKSNNITCKSYKVLSKEKIKFVKDNAKNMTMSQIAKELGTNLCNIYYICKTNNIKCKKFRKRTDIDKQTQFVKDNAKNMTVTEIAKKLNTNTNRIYYICKTNNIKRKYYHSLSEEQIKFVKDNMKSMSISKIAKELKVSYWTVYNIINNKEVD